MPTIAAARLAAEELFLAAPRLLSERLEVHEHFVGLVDEGCCGVRVSAREDGEPSLESAVAAVVAGRAGIDAFRIHFDLIPRHAVDAVASVFSDDGRPKSPDRVIRSILLRYQSGANIILIDGLNRCWRRFATCKELAHILLGDQHQLRTVDVETQLRQALAIVRDPEPCRELNGEELAWFTAIELLLPTAERPAIFERRRRGEETLSIARAYQVPKAIVDLVIESHSGR